MPRLEDFHAGIPLNEELRRLRAGVLDEPPDAAPETPGPWAPEDVERPLTESERIDLKRLLQEPGWRVLARLRKKALRLMEQAAIVSSQNDPLRNAEKIAVGWANFAVYKEMARVEAAMIDGEIGKLPKAGDKD
jgi:hypothetical protein